MVVMLRTLRARGRPAIGVIDGTRTVVPPEGPAPALCLAFCAVSLLLWRGWLGRGPPGGVAETLR